MAPEPGPPPPVSKIPRHNSGRTFGSDGFNVHQARRLHGDSSMESDLESSGSENLPVTHGNEKACSLVERLIPS
ncbi:hypothetical protein AVEN_114040-1, partial [Araneus ventricosus]